MLITDEDLKKKIVTVKIDSMREDDGFSLEKFENFLKDAKKRAKKDGCTDLKIEPFYNEGDENSLPHNYISVFAKRLETEQEWYSRIERIFYENKRDIEELERIPNDIIYKKEMEKKISAAIETSTLRCEVCGKPESSTCHMFNWKKSRRICTKCSDKIWENEMGRSRH